MCTRGNFKKIEEKHTPVGPSPGRGGLQPRQRPQGKWRLHEGGLGSAPWCTGGKESRHPEMLGSVLPLSDHLGKYRAGGNKKLTDLPMNIGKAQLASCKKSEQRLQILNKRKYHQNMLQKEVSLLLCVVIMWLLDLLLTSDESYFSNSLYCP